MNAFVFIFEKKRKLPETLRKTHSNTSTRSRSRGRSRSRSRSSSSSSRSSSSSSGGSSSSSSNIADVVDMKVIVKLITLSLVKVVVIFVVIY